MNFIQLVQLIFSVIGVIWVIMQIRNHIGKMQKQKLGFSMEQMEIITDKDNFIFNEKGDIQYKLYQQKIFCGEKREIEHIKELYSLSIEIKNIGKKSIKCSDFYEADKLGVVNAESNIGVCINNEKTQKYINARIIDVNNDKITIDFDTLKPNDSIYITLLNTSRRYLIKNCVLGKTDEIDKIKAFDIKTAEQVCNSITICEQERLYYKEIFKLLKKTFSFLPLCIIFIYFIICIILWGVVYYVK